MRMIGGPGAENSPAGPPKDNFKKLFRECQNCKILKKNDMRELWPTRVGDVFFLTRSKTPTKTNFKGSYVSFPVPELPILKYKKRRLDSKKFELISSKL